MSVVWDIVWYLFLIAVAICLFDFVWKMIHKTTTRFVWFEPTAPTNNLLVFEPGVQTDGVFWSDAVRDTWCRYAKVMCVDYGTKEFEPENAAKAIADRIINELKAAEERGEKFTQLTLVLSSMGGILGLDTLAKLRGCKCLPDEVVLINIDCIQGAENMLPRGWIPAWIVKWVFRLWYPGLIANKVLRRAYLKFLVVPPKNENIQPGLSKARVKREMVKSASRYELGFWADQMRYMVTYGKLTGDHFKSATKVYHLACTENNETIRQPQEVMKWDAACKDAEVESVVLEVDSHHAAFAEQPKVWNMVFEHVLSGASTKK